MVLPTITPDKIDLPPGTLLHFPGTIADYEAILARLGDRFISWIRCRDNCFVAISYLSEHQGEKKITYRSS